MSASTEPARAGDGSGRPLLAAAWRRGGLIYLAWCLGSLAAGLWPEAIYPSRRDAIPAPLPALQSLAAGQALFILLVHPLILLARARRGGRRYWGETILESLTWLFVTLPFYVAAAWLADATAADVVRAAVCLLLLWPVAWSAGRALQRWKAARPAILLLLLLVAAMPAAWYLAREFLRPMPARWLRDLAPATYLWQAAGSRAGELLPRPFWPAAVHLALGAALAALPLLRRRR
jgi:hypothetical protein